MLSAAKGGSFILLLWVFSAAIPGLMFATLPQQVIVACVIASIVVQTGHQISPVALAWSSSAYREVMLGRPWKYLVLPAATFALALAAPFRWVWCAYWAWNAYHYGMQNFGALMLWRRLRWRRAAMATCLLLTSAPMLAFFVWQPQQTGLVFVFGAAMSFNHWIVDIGLSGRRAGWWFVVVVLLIGLAGFVVYEPTSRGFHRRSDELLQLAMAVGFVHFIFSGWVWKRSGIGLVRG